MEATARKPHRDWAGYIAELRNPITGDHNVIVDAVVAQLDDTDGRYATICNAHGTILNSKSLPAARSAMKDATSFCDGCRAPKGI